MHRYDWDRGYRSHRRRGGYDREYGPWAGGDRWGYDAPFRGAPWGRRDPYDTRGRPGRRGFAPGYDRGEYGPAYPAYGGYPGDRGEGMYYRGPHPYAPGRGWGGGYAPGFADRPFVPEIAYRRHPDYARPPRPAGPRWPDEDEYTPLDESGHDDHEVLQSVRESLYQDDYIDADRIHVSVNGGVVTLTGEVDDFLEARYAWDDAWETLGVRGVVNQLTVRTDAAAEEQPAAAGARAKARKK